MLDKILTKEHIFPRLEFQDKKSVLTFVTNKFEGLTQSDIAEVLNLITSREDRKTYACGKGLAIVHHLTNRAAAISIELVTCSPIIWDAEKTPVSIVLAIISPGRLMDDYLKVLNEISLALGNDALRASIRNMNTADQIHVVIQSMRDIYVARSNVTFKIIQ